MSADVRQVFANRHWKGTDGALDVVTDSITELELGIEDAIEDGSVIGVEGPVGVGKTHALKYILARAGLRTFHLPIGPDPTGKSVEVELLQAVYDQERPGVIVDRSQHRTVLRTELAEAYQRECVVAIDDFDRSKGVGVDAIRWLNEHDTNKAAFVLVGSRLSPLLASDPAFESRVSRIVPFGPLEDGSVAKTMRAWHPLFADLPDDILVRVNREYAGGSFRAWAILLATARKLARRLERDSLSPELIDRAIGFVNKRSRASEQTE